MDIEGIIVNKVAESSGIGANSGEPWKKASYILNINGGSIVFDVMDGRDGRIAKVDALIGKNCCMHMNMNAQMYKGRYYNSITSWGGHEIRQKRKPVKRLQRLHPLSLKLPLQTLTI